MSQRSEQRQRVDARSGDSNRPVQVWTGDATGRSDEPDALAGPNTIALGDLDYRQMCQQREEPQTVVDHHRVAGEIQVPRENHKPGVRRGDRRALRVRKILPAVWAARLTVEDASSTEPVGPAAGHWLNECSIPESRMRRSHP